MTDPSILLARQPIFNRDQQVVAYELLFRPIESLIKGTFDGDGATSQVISNAFTEIGINKVTDNTRAFINYTHKWIMDPPDLDPHRIVMEVLENVEINEGVCNQLRALKQQGIKIALDDFTELNDRCRPALPFVDIIKIDLIATPKENLASLVGQLRQYNVKLVAEKVETHEE